MIHNIVIIALLIVCIFLLWLIKDLLDTLSENEIKIKSLNRRIKNFQEQKQRDEIIMANDERLLDELRKKVL